MPTNPANQPMSNPLASARKVRIGVIGCGIRISGVIKRLLQESPNITITAVYDPDADAVIRFRDAIEPGLAVCANSEELCSRDDVDWVFIGSFNCHHAADTIAAFRAGKHVFCEKPLALNVEEAIAMQRAQAKSGCHFALGLVLRYSPLYRKVRALLDEGKIGSLLSFEFNETLVFNHGGYIHGNWRRNRALAGTHLLEKCCHDIDLALWIVNDLPVRTASFGGCSFFRPENAFHADRIGPNPNGLPAYRAWPDPHGINPFNDDKSIVDHQVAILEFAHGVRATFHTNCHAAIPERRFYLLGTEGTLRVDAYTGVIELRRVGWDEPSVIHQPVEGDSHAGGDELMTKELVHVLAGNQPPAAGFVEGLRSLTTAHAIDTAMDSGTVVDLRTSWLNVAEIFGDQMAGEVAKTSLPLGR